MAVFLIGVVIVLAVFMIGLLLAWLFRVMDKTVAVNQERIELNEKAYNPALTLGYEVKVNATPEEQLKEARRIAAKQAAALPRGANMRIGRAGESNLRTAGQAVKSDPFTAAKIAAIHGWDGAATGIPAGGVPVAPAAAVAAAPTAAPAGPIELVPGKDYPVIEITDDMSPAEVRKARIANSKAKSAAMKAAKASGAPAAAPATAYAAAPAAAAPAPALVGIEPPQLIEITDDMSPDDVRKARIANSKARSTFNKALKAAGIDPATVEIGPDGNVIMPQGAAVAPAPTAPAAPAAAPAAGGAIDLAALGIAPPDIKPITDDMPPDDVRAARIANSKARSAFNKALKAAGVDPKLVEVDDAGNVTVQGGAAPAAAAPAPAPAAAPAAAPTPAAAGSGKVDLAALGIAPPELVEITDDMAPDDVRAARIANSKARSAFNKALKAAGVDPSTVDL